MTTLSLQADDNETISPEEVRAFRRAAIANGYPLIRVHSRDKVPLARGWQHGEDAAALLNAEPEALNTGLLLAGFRCIDIDVDDPQLVSQIIEQARLHLPVGALIRRRANSSRVAIFYRAAEGQPTKLVKKGLNGKIEVLGAGQQAVVHGLHPSGAALTWEDVRGPDTVPLQNVPAVSKEEIGAFLSACAPLLGEVEDRPDSQSPTGSGLIGPGPQPATASPGVAPVVDELSAGIDTPNWFSVLTDEEKKGLLAACLDVLDNRTTDPRDVWLRVLFAVAHAERLGCPEARQLALEWSRCGASWTSEAEFDTAWESYKPKPGGITIGTLLGMAHEAGLDLSQWREAGFARSGEQPGAAQKTVYYVPGNVAVCREALDEAVAADPYTFTMGEKLAVLRVPDRKAPEFENWSGDLPGTTAALPADIIQRAEKLKWMGRAGGNGEVRYKRIHPPRALCGDYITQLRGRYSARPLLGVSRVPFMDDGGSIKAEVGYEPQTCIYHDRLPDLTVPTSPSLRDAKNALRRLLKPFEHYTFDDPQIGPLLVLAAILTALERPFMNTAPMFVVKGAQAGTGKGQMVRAIGHLALGTPPPFMAWGHDDDEFKKRLDAMLFASPAMLVIDNCNGRQLQGDTLEMILSEGTATIRPLGKSEAVTVRNRTFFMANGNNIGISGDMSRRAFIIKIMPRSASPERDTFPFTPEEYVVKRRDALLSDAYTIMRAYRRKGMPRSRLPAVGSFPVWERKVRDLVFWLCGYDLSEEFDKNKRDDPHRQNDAALLAALHTHFGPNWFKASEMEAVLRRATDRRRYGFIQAGMTPTPSQAQAQTAREDAMLEAAEQVFGSKPVNAKTLGYWAKAIENAFVEGFVLLRQMDQHSKSNLIKVEVR